MDIFGTVDSICADVAAEHPTQLTEAHFGVTAKMHHARADGSKLHEASLRERRQTIDRAVPARRARRRRAAAMLPPGALATSSLMSVVFGTSDHFSSEPGIGSPDAVQDR